MVDHLAGICGELRRDVSQIAFPADHSPKLINKRKLSFLWSNASFQLVFINAQEIFPLIRLQF